MATKTLTGASAVLTLSIAGLFDVPQQLQGFSADDVYDMDSQEVTQVLEGVDSKLSGGYVYVATKQNITLQADSDSNQIFESWFAAQVQAQDAYTATGRTTIPALQRSYVSTKGFLTGYTPAPALGKLAKPRKYTITWEKVISNPTS